LHHAISSVFEPDVLVEQDFFRAWRRATPPVPELVLLFAVLNDAIDTFQKFAFSNSVRRQSRFQEVEAWIWDEKSEDLVSFRNICQLIGLHPAYLRRGLLEWRAKNVWQYHRNRRQKSTFAGTSCKKRRIVSAPQGSPTRFRRPRPKGGWIT
jgi:hypothetical protein